MLNGIDISHWNGRKIVSEFANVDFVIMKATEGAGYKDPLLDYYYDNLHGAKDGKPDAKKLYGFYHYARPDLGNTAHDEAENFLDRVGHHAGYAIYALDWEGKSLDARYDEWARRWLDYVYMKTGVKPLVYTSISALWHLTSAAEHDYGLWAAKWNNIPGKLETISPWKIWAIHQYTDSPHDMDVFNGTVEQWRKYAGD